MQIRNQCNTSSPAYFGPYVAAKKLLIITHWIRASHPMHYAMLCDRHVPLATKLFSELFYGCEQEGLNNARTVCDAWWQECSLLCAQNVYLWISKRIAWDLCAREKSRGNCNWTLKNDNDNARYVYGWKCISTWPGTHSITNQQFFPYLILFFFPSSRCSASKLSDRNERSCITAHSRFRRFYAPRSNHSMGIIALTC